MPAATLSHELVAARAPGELSGALAGFVREAAEAGGQVVALVSDQTWAAMVEGLHGRTGALTRLAGHDELGDSGLDPLVDYYHRLAPSLATDRGVWLIGEPPCRTAEQTLEWSAYECVLNVHRTDWDAHVLCVYPGADDDPKRAGSLLATHPLVRTSDGLRASPGSRPPEEYLRDLQPDWTPRPQAAVTHRVADLATARETVRAGVGDGFTRRTDDVVLAVHELVANALRETGRADIATWVEDGRMVWEVADDGPGLDDPVAGFYLPDVLDESGRGLWLVRSLADASMVRADGSGTAIRLHFGR